MGHHTLAVQTGYLHLSLILRPWVLVRSRESNPRPPALQSSALPTELIARYFTCDFFYFHLLGCLSTTDVSSTSPTYPTSPTRFLPVTSSPTPPIQISQPVSHQNLMASFPGSSPTVQPSRPTHAQSPLRRSCSADVRMISPAHVQLVSAIPFPNLQPTESTPRFQTACLQVLNNETLLSY